MQLQDTDDSAETRLYRHSTRCWKDCQSNDWRPAEVVT